MIYAVAGGRGRFAGASKNEGPLTVLIGRGFAGRKTCMVRGGKQGSLRGKKGWLPVARGSQRRSLGEGMDER